MPKLKPGTIIPTPEEDAAINAGIAADPDSSEWTEEDFSRAQPAQKFFEADTYAGLVSLKRKPGQRGPGKRPTKESINIRLSPDVLAPFRATGDGWQTRVDAALREWLRDHTPA